MTYQMISVFLVFSALMICGCATTKKRIYQDLHKIVDAGDCEKSCEALKQYLKDKL